MNDLAVELSGVSKKYRYFTLEDIHLKLPRGQIMGLIGPNGAGKSTTIRILMGLVHQDAGEVRVLGHRLSAGHGHEGIHGDGPGHRPAVRPDLCGG